MLGRATPSPMPTRKRASRAAGKAIPRLMVRGLMAKAGRSADDNEKKAIP